MAKTTTRRRPGRGALVSPEFAASGLPKETALTMERAWRAVKRFDRMTSNLTQFARMLTGDDSIIVVKHPTMTATDGKTIWIAPPIELGDDWIHPRREVCQLRGDDKRMICEACAADEKVEVRIYHEVGHICGASFDKLTDDEKVAAIRDALDEARAAGMNEDRLEALRERMEEVENFIQASDFVSPYVKLIVNAFEDARVNRIMFDRRPGLVPMFEGDVARIMTKGIERLDGSRDKWSEAPPNSQSIIGLFAKASGYDYRGWFVPEIEEFLDDPETTALVERVNKSASVGDVYRHSIATLEHLRKHGYCHHSSDPEVDEDEEPPMGDPGGDCDSDGEPGKGGGDSSGSGAEASSTGTQEGDDNTAEGGSSDPGTEKGQQGTSDVEEGSDDTSEGEDVEGTSDVEEGTSEDTSEGEGDAASDDTSEGDEGDGSSSTDQDDDELDGAGDGDDEESEWDGDFDDEYEDPETGEDGYTDFNEAPDPGDLSAEAPEETMGRPEDVEEDLRQFGGHDEVPDHKDDEGETGSRGDGGPEDDAIARAVKQGDYFEAPSKAIVGVQVHKGDSFRGGYYHDGPVVPVSEGTLSPILQQMRVAFQENRRAKFERNQTRGRIDGRVLAARYPVDDERLFRVRHRPGRRDYFVVIGLDISGSTASGAITIIKRAARAQAEVLNRCGIPFAIYAHTGEYGDTGGMELSMYVVKEPHEPWSDKVKRRLDSVSSRSANLDGHTMEFYRKVLDTRFETDRILLYYTDGAMPAENYREELAILQRELGICEKKGYTVLGVGIGNDEPTKYGLETVQINFDRDLPKVVQFLKSKLT